MMENNSTHNHNHYNSTNNHQLEGEHKGHEGLHEAIYLYLLFWSILLQVLLVFWKQYRPIQFYKVTLCFIWLYPPLISIYYRLNRFTLFWTLFSILFIFMYIISTKNPISRKTPKLVFSVFYFLFLNSIVFSFIGLVCLFLGIDSFQILFYSLYFGVLSRDLSELCSDKIANVLGLGGAKLPTLQTSNSVCAICTTSLKDKSVFANSLMVNELTETKTTQTFKQKLESKFDKLMKLLYSQEPFELSCKHVFHEWCIRGWVIIGKKSSCPTCNEKCEIKLTKNPWDQQALGWWGTLLDATRACIIFLATSQAIILLLDR